MKGMLSQVGNLLASLSTKGCRCGLRRRVGDNGKPRYLQRNSAILQGNCTWTSCNISSPRLKATIELLQKMVRRPEAWPKQRRISLIPPSSLFGRIKSTTSSANRDSLWLIFHGAKLWNTPTDQACLTTTLSTSITRIKRRGESVSPCLNPQPCQILSPGLPLTMVLVLEEDRIRAIHAIHLFPNPLAMHFQKKWPRNWVKTLATSSFRRAGLFFSWSSLADCWTNKKLSLIHIPLIKCWTEKATKGSE